MATKLVQLLIDYFHEDPDAWSGASFMKHGNAKIAAKEFLILLNSAAGQLEEDIPMRQDPMGLLALLTDVLDPQNFDDDSLIELGNAIIDRAD